MPKKQAPKKQLYPQRAFNTAIDKMTAGPDQFAKRRERMPHKYLSEDELDRDFRPRKPKKK